MKDEKIVKEILSFFEKKHALFERYLGITIRMRESCNGKDTVNLGALISERHDCLCSIKRIDSLMKRSLKSGGDVLSHSSTNLKTLINRYVKLMRDTMKTANSTDSELMSMVKEEKDKIKTALLEMRKFREATQGYTIKRGCYPKFLDSIR